MTSLNHEEFLQRLEKNGPTETQRYYLERIRCSSISPEELSKCELLDLSTVGKAISRNLRVAKRSPYYQDCAGIYVQVNATARWDVKIGLLPEIINSQDITQTDLYYKQLIIIPCIDSDDAADLYSSSQDMPYETVVCEYVWFSTLIQIWKAVRCFELPTYAGIAHSDIWIELISAQKT